MVLGIDLFFSLFNNLAIFIALVVIYIYLLKIFINKNWFFKQFLFGLLFGMFAIICMNAKIPVFNGVIVDQRNAIVTLCGAFCGPLAAFLCATIAGVYRFYLGGDGVLAGIIGVHLAAVSGIILYKWKKSFESFQSAFLSSFIATLIILPGFLFVGNISFGLSLLKSVSLPYGLAIFIGIFLVGLLLKREEKQVQTAIDFHESEEKYRTLFESFPLGIMISDINGKIIETNNTAEKIFGIKKDSLYNKKIDDDIFNLIKIDGSKLSSDELKVLTDKENAKIDNFEVGLQQNNGEVSWINVNTTSIPLENYGIAVIYNDITERKNYEIQLNKALSEKSVLIQELYHRTKNNMMVIISLLELQSVNIKDPEFLLIIEETKNRIYSMSLIHQKLYKSKDLSHINLKSYIQDLLAVLVKTYKVSNENIEISYKLQDVFLNIDLAMPCGLILQELISNIFKHAFVDGKVCEVSIELKKINHTIQLKIIDNGDRLNENFDFRKDGRFGINVIYALAEEQLNGQISFVVKNGLTVILEFRDDLYSRRL